MDQPPVPRFAALRYRDFRLLWLGQLFAVTGNAMQFIAVNWHVYTLLEGTEYTISLLGFQFPLQGQALGLGVVGLVRILPVMLFGLVGGVLADIHDRRRLIIWSQSAACLFTVGLAAITLSGNVSLAALYALTAAISGVSAFETPAQQALLPQLVPREHFTNAVSLNQLMHQFGTIGGPAIAGVMIGAFPIGLVYALNGVSFLILLLALSFMRPQERPGTGAATTEGTIEPCLFGVRLPDPLRLLERPVGRRQFWPLRPSLESSPEQPVEVIPYSQPS